MTDHESTTKTTSERLDALESHVQTLTQALRALTEGLEQNPADEPAPDPLARSARLAHEILLAQGL